MGIIVQQKQRGESELSAGGDLKGNHVVRPTGKNASLNLVFTGWPAGWNEWEDFIEEVIRL